MNDLGVRGELVGVWVGLFGSGGELLGERNTSLKECDLHADPWSGVGGLVREVASLLLNPLERSN
jgi:hypothetical protein